MLDGLHQKLLGNGLALPPVPLPVPQFLLLFVSSVVPVGKPAAKVVSHGLVGKSTPLPNTVMAAPSNAPINDGSCSNSARLPFSVASHPTAASKGRRSTCGLIVSAFHPPQPAPQVGTQLLGEPSIPRPTRQSIRARHVFILPAGCVLALMMLVAAPTPCSRTGFHICNISL